MVQESARLVLHRIPYQFVSIFRGIMKLYMGLLLLVLASHQLHLQSAEALWVCTPSEELVLNSHNENRAKHGSPPLVMDSTLQANAAKCAAYYVNKSPCQIDHTCPYKEGAGENLVGGPGMWSQKEMAKYAADGWYGEVKDYDYNKPGFALNTGHFTQVVWKSATKFGFNVAQLNGCTVGVGLYFPHGNLEGAFKENVFPPTK